MARFYRGAQMKSIAPSVKAVIMAFHCRFCKLSSALWFALWRSGSISTCFAALSSQPITDVHMIRIPNITHCVSYARQSPFLRINSTPNRNITSCYWYALSWDRVGLSVDFLTWSNIQSKAFKNPLTAQIARVLQVLCSVQIISLLTKCRHISVDLHWF